MTLFRMLMFTIHYVNSYFFNLCILLSILFKTVSFSFLLILCLLPCYIVELNIILISTFIVYVKNHFFVINLIFGVIV